MLRITKCTIPAHIGKDPESCEAIEFLCLAEGGEVTHYEVLSALTKGVKNKKFGTNVKAILAEEKRHLQPCTRLAKEIAFLSYILFFSQDLTTLLYTIGHVSINK